MISKLLPAFALFFVSCSSMRSPIVDGAKPKDHGAIGATEGPAWKDGSLYFTDGKHINRMGPDGKTSVFRHNASNGLLFDREGRLVACETKNRRVTRTEKGGSITVLADRFEGKRFNSPNDLCMDSKGRIYFTDPRYGSREGMEIPRKCIRNEMIHSYPNHNNPCVRLIGGIFDCFHVYSDLSATSVNGRAVKLGLSASKLDELLSTGCFLERYSTYEEGVYRIDSPGKVTKVMNGGGQFRLERPNGILISPDDRFLFIADNNNNTHGGSRKLIRYELGSNGDVKVESRKVLFDWKDGRGPDGMKMDAAGRIYVVAGTNTATEFETTRFKAGCYILSPSGRLIDFIPTAPDEACNCTFGGADGKTLFITSGGHLWSVPLK
ncbi:MAG: SMP-30/gluconolactonase/LRE family protein [Verrucomicrobiaceae bacterium]|nr:SMP-30/gluconolactonase/LRE family protein [Verrucomicrobiaceae bacterium]